MQYFIHTSILFEIDIVYIYNRAEKEKFIIMKYADREFIHRGLPSNCETVDIAFHEATKEGNLAFMLKYLLQGANVNWRDPANHLRSALHLAVIEDLHITVEYLLMWSADCLVTDDENLSPIHYAIHYNRLQMSLNLLRRAFYEHDGLDLHEFVQSALSNISDVDVSSLVYTLESGQFLDSPSIHRIFSNQTCTSETNLTSDLELDKKELPPLPECIRCLSESTDSGAFERNLPDPPELPHRPGFEHEAVLPKLSNNIDAFEHEQTPVSLNPEDPIANNPTQLYHT